MCVNTYENITMRPNVALTVAMLIQATATAAWAIMPDDPGPAAVRFTINSLENRRVISPYIYGSNSSAIANRTFDRSGGNRMTGYNWETNASNAGADWYHHSDYHLTGGQANRPPGAAVSGMIQSAAANGRAALITVPMAGYVAADANGTVDETQLAPSSRWKQVVAKKATIYPGSPFSSNPNTTDAYVFTDEFVNWAESTKQAGQPLWYSLDNEPGLWGESLPAGWQSGSPPNPCCNPANGVNPSPQGRTHPTLHPYAPTFNELRDKTIAHSTAIKDVNPNALVFGGVGYGWNEFTTLQDAPGRVTSPAHPGGDQTGELHYYEWLLKEVATAEAQQGRKLMDVLDLHWYPEAQGGGVRITGGDTSAAVVAARVQAPRSLWDPTYTETSWISQWSTWVGTPGNPGPVQLLPRVQRDIDDFNPGTKIAITEYNYGGGSHYSGGIAQADFLGILGREGVLAANWWDLGNGSSYVNSAFEIFRNYDGAGGRFGDTSIDADSSLIGDAAVYGSVDSADPSRMVLVAINRTGSAKTTGIAVTHDRLFDRAEVYRFAGGSPNIARAADIELELRNAFQYTMPAWSVTALVLTSDGPPGDFNFDGQVDAADYVVWRKIGGGGSEYANWRATFGMTVGQGGGFAKASVPEPSSWLLIATGIALHCWSSRRGTRSVRANCSVRRGLHHSWLSCTGRRI
jgi:hypothetical protein